jgi:hypothetical protein
METDVSEAKICHFTQRNVAEDLNLDLCYVYFCDVGTDSLWLVFQPFYNRVNTNNILRNPCLWKRFQTRKQRGSWSRTGNTPVLPIGEQKFPLYFENYFELFAMLQFIFVFIPRFLAEPFTAFSVALVGKYCFRLTSCFKEPMSLIMGLGSCRSYLLRGPSWGPSRGPGLTL